VGTVTSRRLSGRIVHNDKDFATRLNGGVFEWSGDASREQLVRAALRAGAIMERRRAAVKAGIEPLALKVYCMGVTTERANV
jgi:hypothetical protein